FDIGIMPLENSEWNKGKCAFKAVEYMACGVPVIISNVGENKFLIKNNVNGFLVENKYDWIKTVSYLILKDKERLEMGLKGRKTIEDRYSYRVNIPKLISFLK
ncbi:glycosyltransferase, partial [Patescibacteria group bacterium]|nr:glycosyltransferase [Patescibacteria group bacterium]